MVVQTQHELDKSSFHKSGLESNDIKSHQNSPQKAVKKKVRFASHNRVRKILHINDLSDEEVDAVWMHPDEFRAIRKECQSIILFIEHSSDVPDGMELRGLEHHMLNWKEQAQAVQQLLYDTADKIQDYGDDSSIDVSDMLASMCHKISSRQEALAREIALEDEEEAKA